MTAGAPKSPNNVASTFFNPVHSLPKDLKFEHGGAKLDSCPGRHLTSVRPCVDSLGFEKKQTRSLSADEARSSPEPIDKSSLADPDTQD